MNGFWFQKPVVVMPAKKSRAKEVAAYDYTGPSDIEIYDNGVVRMAADGKSSRAKKWL
jgi:hypothetical protein